MNTCGSKPFPTSFIEENSDIARRIVSLGLKVMHVLGAIKNTKISLLIVESVHIDVVSIRPFGGVHDLSVHPNFNDFLINPNAPTSVTPRCAMPFMGGQFVVIFIINFCEFATGKRDKFHSL